MFHTANLLTLNNETLQAQLRQPLDFQSWVANISSPLSDATHGIVRAFCDARVHPFQRDDYENVAVFHSIADEQGILFRWSLDELCTQAVDFELRASGGSAENGFNATEGMMRMPAYHLIKSLHLLGELEELKFSDLSQALWAIDQALKSDFVVGSYWQDVAVGSPTDGPQDGCRFNASSASVSAAADASQASSGRRS